MARRTKIQLLIRREEDQGFEVRAVPSALAYLQYRPQRIADSPYELDRKSTRLNSSHIQKSRMPSSA